ncbi:MAG: TetR/AcrR family transcriptional regulator [Ilumatobacter sp.]
MTNQAPQGIRARARAELLAEVSRIARNHLATAGASELSVRAIARELDMASSALYRYYPSRDALLTQLIIEAYSELGNAVETAEAAVERSDFAGRYRAAARAVRTWSRANPHEYALIYGSPVAGYEAPSDTVDPALRAASVMIRLTADIAPTEHLRRASAPLDPVLIQQLERSNEFARVDGDLDVLVVGVGLWAQLFGLISFELFGTFRNAFDPADELFEHQLDLAVRALGLEPD